MLDGVVDVATSDGMLDRAFGGALDGRLDVTSDSEVDGTFDDTPTGMLYRESDEEVDGKVDGISDSNGDGTLGGTLKSTEHWYSRGRWRFHANEQYMENRIDPAGEFL
jgi:hypothetical protein